MPRAKPKTSRTHCGWIRRVQWAPSDLEKLAEIIGLEPADDEVDKENLSKLAKTVEKAIEEYSMDLVLDDAPTTSQIRAALKPVVRHSWPLLEALVHINDGFTPRILKRQNAKVSLSTIRDIQPSLADLHVAAELAIKMLDQQEEKPGRPKKVALPNLLFRLSDTFDTYSESDSYRVQFIQQVLQIAGLPPLGDRRIRQILSDRELY